MKDLMEINLMVSHIVKSEQDTLKKLNRCLKKIQNLDNENLDSIKKHVNLLLDEGIPLTVKGILLADRIHTINWVIEHCGSKEIKEMTDNAKMINRNNTNYLMETLKHLKETFKMLNK